MRGFQDTAMGSNSDGHPVWVRLLRGVGLTFLPSPLVFVVAAGSLWLLVLVVLGLGRAQAEGLDWGVSDVVSCSGCILALAVIACLAVGYIVLMFIAGWKGSRA